MFHVSKLKSSIYLRLKTEIIFLKSIIKMLPYWVVMFSLRSSLFRFLLAGESESLGEVARTHGARAKRRTGERGWRGNEKSYIIPNARSSTNGRQLGIMIGQSRVKTINANSLSMRWWRYCLSSLLSSLVPEERLWMVLVIIELIIAKG